MPTPEQTLHVNGVDLAARTSGDPAAPAVLLISGAEATMDWWDEEFVARLANGGRYVVRYDTRDTGRSTTWPVGAPGYTQADLVADAIGVLDALRIRAAHVVGISMGGAIAQRLCVGHPDRVATLTLIATGPDGRGGPGHPGLPPMTDELAKWFEHPAGEPDWTDRESVVAHFVAAEHAFAGTIPVDEESLRRTAGRAFDRSPVPAAAGNHRLIEGGTPVRDRLGAIAAPTLVLHGTEDPFLPYAHGEALAREIPGARLVPLPGMGHQMPPREVWNTALSAILTHTARA
ncbi:alpha/beta fold hydrolase [Streptomyces sp. NPDC089799]|uniref:alpha/beta fold hydrolase n=1 Tax=Streptomyces sp. NPDC089799 TaxID=3155066 RepID=UPI003413C127